MRQVMVMVAGETPMSLEEFKKRFPYEDPKTGEPLTREEWNAAYQIGTFDDTGRAIYERGTGKVVSVL